MFLNIKPLDCQSRLKAFFRPLLIVPVLALAMIMLNHHGVTSNMSSMQQPPAAKIDHNQLKDIPKIVSDYYLEPADFRVKNEHFDSTPYPALEKAGTVLSHLNKLSPLSTFSAIVGILFSPLLLTLLFLGKYPTWWYEWNVQITRFLTRITAYSLFLTDKYPSIDSEQDISLNIPKPDPKLSRGLPLVKWLLATPHWIILFFAFALVSITWIISWLSIIIMGKQPKALFNFHVGILRYKLRVMCYASLLVTDKYPRFSLHE